MVEGRADVGRAVSGTVNAIWLRLDAAELEPALARRGDEGLLRAAAELAEALEQGAIARLDELRAQLSDPEELESYETAIAYCAAAISGLRFLARATTEATESLKRAGDLAPPGELGDLLREGAHNPEAFIALLHAQWLMRKERFAAARLCARAQLRGKLGTETARALQQIADIPEPLTTAPALFRLNGCGVALLGQRDLQENGSYVATRYLTVLFLPIFPLDAFRVTRASGGFRFHGKVGLDARAHQLRRLVVAIALVAAAVSGGIGYLGSDRHQLNLRLAEAAQLEARAHDSTSRDAAAERYERIFGEYREKVAPARLEPVALGVARLTMLALGDTLQLGEVDEALTALRRFASFPEASRGGDAAAFVEARVDSWVKSLGSADSEHTTSSLRLLGVANIALGSPLGLAQREQALYLNLGEALEPEWPVVALELLASAPEQKGAAVAVEKALAALPPTALEALNPVLEDWIDGHVALPAFAKSSALLEAVRKRAEARKEDLARAELLEKGSEDQLKSALSEHPEDPAFSIALAQRLQLAGETTGALAVLERLGAVGRLSESAALMYGRLSAELGRSRAAEEVYEHWLLLRLPAYGATSFKLTHRELAKRREFSDLADHEALPAAISKQIREAADGEQARSLYGDWVDEQLKKDTELERLRTRLGKLDTVVSVALDLGMLQLESAQATEGEPRVAALAKAERTFLSIQAGGEDLPAYHLGLGTVFYRLGKSADGEREFQVLLARKDPELALDVARRYRDLGQHSRANEVAQGVFDQSKDEVKNRAAILLSLLADTLEDQEKWLMAADQSSSYVKSSLTEVQASKAFRAGDLTLADEKFQRAYELYANEPDKGASGANNAAVALSARYGCTGDPHHLIHAVELLEKARRLAPTDAVILQNLERPLSHLAELDALRSWLNTPVLKLSADELESVIGWLDAGESRDAVLTALRQSSYLRRARDVARQARVLGPSWQEPYYSELRWATIFEDAEGITAVKQQVQAAERIDREAAKRQREHWISGVDDARTRLRVEGAIVRYTATLAKLEAANAGPSRAVIRALWADQEDSLSLLDSDGAAHAEKALVLLRQAQQDWPALKLQAELASQLARLALLRLGPSTQAELRRAGSTLSLWRRMRDSNSAELAKLKAQPELLEAAKALSTAPDRSLSPLSFVLGTLLGNQELLDRTRRQLARPELIPLLETESLLSEDEVDRARLEMVRAMLQATN